MSERVAFQCPYAERGQKRCPEWRCDCFIDTYPDDPFGLHPEAFRVVWAEDQQRGAYSQEDGATCRNEEPAR